MLLVIVVGVAAALALIVWTLSIARSASCPHCQEEGAADQPLIPFLAAFLWFCPACGRTSRLSEVRSGEVSEYERPGGLRGRVLSLLLGPDPTEQPRQRKRRRGGMLLSRRPEASGANEERSRSIPRSRPAPPRRLPREWDDDYLEDEDGDAEEQETQRRRRRAPREL